MCELTASSFPKVFQYYSYIRYTFNDFSPAVSTFIPNMSRIISELEITHFILLFLKTQFPLLKHNVPFMTGSTIDDAVVIFSELLG